MKFTSIKTTRQNKLQLGVHDAEWFMQRITYETKEMYTTGFRHYLKDSSEWGRYIHLSEIPRLCVSVEYRRTATGDLAMARFNGLVVLEVRELAGEDACEKMKQRAMMSPSTWAAFVGASGHTVKILVRVAPANGEQPQAEVEAEDFYVKTYRQLVPIYDGLLGCRVTRIEPRLRYAFLMPLDPNPLVNTSAAPFLINTALMPTPDDTELHLLALPEPPRDYREADMEMFLIHQQQYAKAAQHATERLHHTRRYTNEWWKAFVTSVLTELCEGGMGEEEAVCVVWNALRFKDEPGLTEDYVRTAAEAVYADTKPAGGTTSNNASQMMRDLIRRMDTRYVLRYNTIMGYPEFRPNHTWPTPWRPVTDEVIKTFTTDLMLAGLNVWDRDVQRYVFSTRVREFNPIEDYLWNCQGKWDGHDRIRALAATVPTPDAEQWAEWFHTWFLAMVAQWTGRNPRYGNAIVPLLVSAQGMHKSTFCRNLLPQELRSWGYTDNLSLGEERPVHLAMSQMLLINLDEFNRISPQKQQGFLKNILQLPSVKVKRPYGKHIEDAPRLASFIATTNMGDVLTDPSGSRRFLGIHVKGSIDVSQTPNHEQLYAQAQQELEEGARYWFDEAETEQIMRHNRQFQLQPSALQFFLEHFEPGVGDQGRWLSASAILQELRQRCGSVFVAPSVNTFGRQLHGQEGLMCRHSRIGEQYYIQDRQRA